jgi:hypothetical protein
MIIFYFLSYLKSLFTKELIVVNYKFIIVLMIFFNGIFLISTFNLVYCASPTSYDQLINNPVAIKKAQEVIELLNCIVCDLPPSNEIKNLYIQIMATPKGKFFIYDLLVQHVNTVGMRLMLPYNFVVNFTANDLPLDYVPCLKYNVLMPKFHYFPKLCLVQVFTINTANLSFQSLAAVIPYNSYSLFIN